MRSKSISLKKKQMVTGIFFVAPWVLGFLSFFAYNLFQTILYSFSDVKILDSGGFDVIPVGMYNYMHAVMVHATFNRELTESLSNVLIDVALIVFFSLFISLILNRTFKGRSMVRAIFFLPVIMAAGAIVDALDANLRNITGGVSATLEEFSQVEGLNVTSIVFLLTDFGMPVSVINYIVDAAARVYEIVRSSGVQILIFLAALQSISPALYEVADIEGATKYESFWKITFPMVSPLILTNVVYTIVNQYENSEIVVTSRNVAFAQMDFGLSSAMTMMSSTSICIILAVVSFLISKKVFYMT